MPHAPAPNPRRQRESSCLRQHRRKAQMHCPRHLSRPQRHICKPRSEKSRNASSALRRKAGGRSKSAPPGCEARGVRLRNRIVSQENTWEVTCGTTSACSADSASRRQQHTRQRMFLAGHFHPSKSRGSLACATWQQMKWSHCRVLAYDLSWKSSCWHWKHESKRGEGRAHHNPITSPWQFHMTIPRGGDGLTPHLPR